jgi:hypothetical protein
MQTYHEDSDYSEYEYDEYDVHPLKTKPSGGCVNKPFHSGKGIRAKEAFIKEHLENNTIKNNTQKK